MPTPPPTPTEIHAALAVLAEAGWAIATDEAYGILSDLGPEHGNILQIANSAHPRAKRYIRGRAQEPWRQKQ